MITKQVLLTNMWFDTTSTTSIYYLDIYLEDDTWSYWISSLSRNNMSYSILLF